VTKFTLLAICALCWADSRPAFGTITLQSPNPILHDRFQNDASFIGNPYNWSGIGRSSDARWGTLISDSYFLSATHFHPVDGSTLTFFHTNNPLGASEVRTVESGQQIAGSDLWLGKLSAPVSSNVAKYSILDLPNESDYFNQIIYTHGVGVGNPALPTVVRLGRNRIDANSIFDTFVIPTTGRTFRYDYDNPGGLGADESRVELGDSGGPSFIISGGQPALVGIHWFQTGSGSGSGDTFIPFYLEDVQAAIPEPASIALAWVAFVSLCRVARSRRKRGRR
jgi:hypothetical protein